MTLQTDLFPPELYRNSHPGPPPRPNWLCNLLPDPAPSREVDDGSGVDLTVIETAEFRLVRARVEHAAELDPLSFQSAVQAAYVAIARQIDAPPRRFPVRFWNYIPNIHQRCGEGVDRYMVFNAGRFAALREWLASEAGGLEGRLPTASGIGHYGSDLIIDALAASAPGIQIENPRQTPAHRYGPRYGARPPCFARATMLPDGDILVGGTASILGQDSQHPGDMPAQFQETLRNLASVLGSATKRGQEDLSRLDRFREVRIFHPRRQDAPAIRHAAIAAFGGAKRMEFIPADLCRPELLVEIEGIAR